MSKAAKQVVNESQKKVVFKAVLKIDETNELIKLAETEVRYLDNRIKHYKNSEEYLLAEQLKRKRTLLVDAISKLRGEYIE